MEQEKSIVRALIRAGQAKEKASQIMEVLGEVDTSKHNEFWYVEDDDKQDDFLWDLRAKIMMVDEEIANIWELLSEVDTSKHNEFWYDE